MSNEPLETVGDVVRFAVRHPRMLRLLWRLKRMPRAQREALAEALERDINTPLG